MKKVILSLLALLFVVDSAYALSREEYRALKNQSSAIYNRWIMSPQEDLVTKCSDFRELANSLFQRRNVLDQMGFDFEEYQCEKSNLALDQGIIKMLQDRYGPVWTRECLGRET